MAVADLGKTILLDAGRRVGRRTRLRSRGRGGIVRLRDRSVVAAPRRLRR